MNSATTCWEMATSRTKTPSSWVASQSVSAVRSARVCALAPAAPIARPTAAKSTSSMSIAVGSRPLDAYWCSSAP